MQGEVWRRRAVGKGSEAEHVFKQVLHADEVVEFVGGGQLPNLGR